MSQQNNIPISVYFFAFAAIAAIYLFAFAIFGISVGGGIMMVGGVMYGVYLKASDVDENAFNSTDVMLLLAGIPLGGFAFFYGSKVTLFLSDGEYDPIAWGTAAGWAAIVWGLPYFIRNFDYIDQTYDFRSSLREARREQEREEREARRLKRLSGMTGEDRNEVATPVTKGSAFDVPPQD